MCPEESGQAIQRAAMNPRAQPSLCCLFRSLASDSSAAAPKDTQTLARSLLCYFLVIFKKIEPSECSFERNEANLIEWLSI
jgi:hypothetical protein